MLSTAPQSTPPSGVKTSGSFRKEVTSNNIKMQQRQKVTTGGAGDAQKGSSRYLIINFVAEIRGKGFEDVFAVASANFHVQKTVVAVVHSKNLRQAHRLTRAFFLKMFRYNETCSETKKKVGATSRLVCQWQR